MVNTVTASRTAKISDLVPYQVGSNEAILKSLEGGSSKPARRVLEDRKAIDLLLSAPVDYGLDKGSQGRYLTPTENTQGYDPQIAKENALKILGYNGMFQ